MDPKRFIPDPETTLWVFPDLDPTLKRRRVNNWQTFRDQYQDCKTLQTFYHVMNDKLEHFKNYTDFYVIKVGSGLGSANIPQNLFQQGWNRSRIRIQAGLKFLWCKEWIGAVQIIRCLVDKYLFL
jgi:hypothetical protein